MVKIASKNGGGCGGHSWLWPLMGTMQARMVATIRGFDRSLEVTISPLLENVLKKSAHYFVAPSHFTLYPKDVKFKDWLLKNEPWPLAGFLHDFSFLV